VYAGLRSGAVDRLTEFAWPTPAAEAPGSWVEAGVDAPHDAVRGFPVEQLPWWLDDELWQLELAGEQTAELRRTRATRGRLIRRVETWTPEVATSLVEVCAQRLQEAAVGALVREGRREEADTLVAAGDLERLEQTGNLVGQAGASEGGRLASFAADVVLYARDAGRPAAGAAVAAYIAAHALAGGDKTVRTYAARFEVERGWQAEWLRGRLRL
jgi:hypothetical protein